jgi:hypothetical protein
MRTERTIRNCRVRMKVVCPRIWEGLEVTESPDVRHCGQCNEDVYFCRTDAETIAHAVAGHCVARERPHSSEFGPMILGRPAVPYEPTPAQARAREVARREGGIDSLLNGRLLGSERECPRCAYPVPEFRKTCYVCGMEVGRTI